VSSASEDRRLAAENRHRAASYLSDAYRDDTTGALNRRPGREQMQALLERARRDESVLTFIVLDVDGPKRVNDSEGHERGDAVLAAVGMALRSSLRSYDLVVRYGGDEFVCALPGSTERTAQETLARVISAVERLIPGATISAGCAELGPADTLDDVIRRADTDLYQERRFGHGCVRLTTGLTQARAQQRTSVACGACGGRVDLSEFVLELTPRMTRSADCPDCGETTMIQLAPVASERRPGDMIGRPDGG
jgi:diguanylate cyclase (GGDEF)-like protein